MTIPVPGRAVRWGDRSGPGLGASLSSKSGLWLSSSNFLVYQLRQWRDWRASTGRPCRAPPDGGGEHGEPVRPLCGWRARLPYGHCNASLVERPVWWVHTVVAVKVPHEPPECPIMLGRTGRKLPVEGLCNRPRAGVGKGARSDGKEPLGEGVSGRKGRTGSLLVREFLFSGGCCRWDRGGEYGAAPRGQLPVICCGMNSSAAAVAPLVAHRA